MITEQLQLIPDDPAIVAANKRNKLQHLIHALAEAGMVHDEAWRSMYGQLSTNHGLDIDAAVKHLSKTYAIYLTKLDFIEACGWVDEAKEIAAELLRQLRDRRPY